MAKKRITEIFPFLLPLRKKQRKICFYLKMKFDKNQYAKHIEEKLLPHKIYETKSKMINENSGFDIVYQENKIYNLKLASKKISGVVIRPNETFSLWKLIQHADKNIPYKDGLILVNGNIVALYGGGLCQLSNLIFEVFLHSPLTVIERHGHTVSTFPSSPDAVKGIDATIAEGWKDLKIKNNTDKDFQIEISFDNEYIYGKLLCNQNHYSKYEIFNEDVVYYKKDDKIMQKSSVNRKEINMKNKGVKQYHLYNDICEIGYELPKDIKLKQ